ncbi:MAG: D-ribose ABC transporter substrate-binding protein [Actinomycetaceae bacterium]|nr:D-ribose ABC transporter substrate-binding protein [Actinomycetaceae bacterium]
MKKQLVKAISVGAMFAMVTLGLSACSNNGSAGSASGGGKNLALMVSTLNNPFFVDLSDGAKAEAKAKGYNLEVSDAQNDSATQANQISNAVSKNVGAVIINPVDSDAAGPSVSQLNSSNIPVIAIDRGVSTGKLASFVSSDNVAGGKLAAQTIAKSLGGTGEMIVLQGVPGTSAARDRGKGFEEGIKAFPGIKVVASQTANFDRAQGLDVTTNLMQAHPGVKAIFAQNDEIALGAVKALGAKAGKDVLVFGFDGTDDGLNAIKSGTMLGTVAQQPKELGKMAVDQAISVLEKKQVKKTLPVEVKIVSKDTVAEYQK